MNKIKIIDEKIIYEESDDLIEVSLSDKLDIFDIIKLNIKVMKDTDIEIYYEDAYESKLDVLVEIDENVNCNLYELKTENDVKIQYKYYLNIYSNLNVHKFYDCNKVN